MPFARITIRRLMIAVAAIAIGMLALRPHHGTARWVGQASIPLEFLVVDATTDQPIECASILLEEGRPSADYEAATGPDGRAKVVVEAITTGTTSPVENTRRVKYDWTLVIAADHHVGATLLLEDLTRGPRYHSDPAPPAIVIRLAPD